jgi:polysaccharide biosynthesis PFTS motif protein
MTWGNIWVLESNAASFLAELPHTGEIQRAADTPLVDAPATRADLGEATVVIFDVMPTNPVRLATYGMPPSYYNNESMSAFLQPGVDACRQCGVKPALKIKREMPAELKLDSYQQLIERLHAAGDLILLDHSVDALRYIQQAKAVISVPFTTTAIYAERCAVPSIFYDSTDTLKPPPNATEDVYQFLSHGIPIVRGPQALVAWVKVQLRDVA